MDDLSKEVLDELLSGVENADIILLRNRGLIEGTEGSLDGTDDGLAE